MPRKILLLLLLGSLLAGTVSAQTATPIPTATPAPCTTANSVPSRIRTEPTVLDNSNPGTISLTGSDFDASTTVRLLGFGYLTATLINANALTAAVPAGVPPGAYAVEVVVGGIVCRSVDTLNISQPVVPLPFPTFPVPPEATQVLGQPNLLIRNFTVSPNVVTPGAQIAAAVEVVNDGNLPAFGITVSVDAGGPFAPVGGAAVSVPDLFPGGSAYVTLRLIVGPTATPGANFVPLTLTYRDNTGKQYTSKASLSAVVDTGSSLPLITIQTYSVTPQVVVPGQTALITAQIHNSGDKTANQVLVRLTGTDSVLIAGPRGDAFPIGDITPGSTAIVEIPLIVAQNAKAGVQPQAFTLSYVLDGKATELQTTLTVTVATITTPLPIILLDNARISSSEVRPGEQFTLSFSLKNVGDGTASNMLVSFGTVESSGGGGAEGTPGGDSSTTTRASSQFAPLGTGATQFVGTMDQNRFVDLTQDFIANVSLESGIYGLPITARYNREDGTTATDSFTATVLVVGLPRLQVKFDTPLPASTDQFSSVPVAVTIINRGKNPLMIDRIEVTGEGIDVYDGAITPVGQLKTDEEISVAATISPTIEGTFTVVLNVYYMDDLNRPQVLPLTYEAESIALPPPPDFTPEPELPIIETPTPEPPAEDLFSKLLLGFLGLGE